MSNFDQRFTMNTAAYAMGNAFRDQKLYESLGTVITVFWLFGGLFNDAALYFVSMFFSMMIFLYSTLVNLDPRRRSYLVIHASAFRRLFVAVIARWGYSEAGNTGPSAYPLFDYSIPVNEFANWVIVVLLFVWLVTKYADIIDKNGFKLTNTPFLIVRGILRGAMLVGVFIAIFDITNNGRIPEDFEMPLFLVYLFEPYIFYIYSQFNQSYSSSDMVMGDFRLPAVALRESFASNLLLLLITGWFGGFPGGNEWELLRVYYFLGLVFTVVLSIEAIKDYNRNPLGKGPLSDFLNNTPSSLHDIDLASKTGLVVDKDTSLNLGNDSTIDLKPGSLVIPIEENKGKVTAMIVGKSESVIKDSGEKVAQSLDGITTALIPSKQIKSVRKKFNARSLREVDFDELNLPSLESIQNLTERLGLNLGNWVDSVKQELTQFKLSNYGVTETEDGTTFVNLPGISVVDGSGFSSVKVGGIRVLDTPQASTVRIGNFLTVVDFPKVNFVSLPGITVLDMGGKGTAVDIFGFKVSEKIPAESLDDFKTMFMAQISKWENSIDSQIGQLLTKSNGSAQMSINWAGEFKPLLATKAGSFGDHPALGPARQEASRLLTSTTTSDLKMITSGEQEVYDFIGVDPTKQKVVKSKSKSSKAKVKKQRVKYDLEVGFGENKKRVSNIPEVLEEERDKLSKKLDKINKKLESITDDIDTKKEKDDPDYDFKEIHDVDYEIVDEDEE